MARKPEIRALDLFCGGGGSSIGAKAAGVTPVAGVDLWPVATDAFAANFRNAKTYTTELSKLRPSKVKADLGRIDMLLASPECTHHSIARGNKPRREDSKQLAYQVIRFAKTFRPQWIVVENVIQMRSWPSFEHWLGRLNKLGYNTLHLTLDAEQFGVPQTRKRLFVICDRKRMPGEPRVYRRKDATVERIIEKANRNKWSFNFTPLDNGKRAVKTIERAERAIESLGKDQEFIMVYYGSDYAGGFQTLNRPLRTITTLDRFALVKPNCVGHEMRMLQPSELAVAMGFPPNYNFPKLATRRDCIKLMGNAVCPPVMSAIVRTLLKPKRVTRQSP